MIHAQHDETSARPSGAPAIMIMLDILVIFALTARWDEARAAV